MSAAAKQRLHAAGTAQDQNTFYIQLILAKRSQISTGPQRNLWTSDARATMNVTLLSRKTKYGDEKKQYEKR